MFVQVADQSRKLLTLKPTEAIPATPPTTNKQELCHSVSQEIFVIGISRARCASQTYEEAGNCYQSLILVWLGEVVDNFTEREHSLNDGVCLGDR